MKEKYSCSTGKDDEVQKTAEPGWMEQRFLIELGQR